MWVAKSGGDFQTVTAALDTITTASATNRYVIKIAPGTYNEPAGIVLKNYVDMEGSGQTNTVIITANESGALRHHRLRGGASGLQLCQVQEQRATFLTEHHLPIHSCT